jgi:uncharacterized radical SAM superfamily Fe-S cluster-containing enzyme
LAHPRAALSYNELVVKTGLGEELSMGTCPKCKRKIRHNGNHIKLGQVWYHKACPERPAKAKQP